MYGWGVDEQRRSQKRGRQQPRGSQLHVSSLSPPLAFPRPPFSPWLAVGRELGLELAGAREPLGDSADMTVVRAIYVHDRILIQIYVHDRIQI
jgi:hypothetical protein